jgi:hypothetical protein
MPSGQTSTRIEPVSPVAPVPLAVPDRQDVSPPPTPVAAQPAPIAVPALPRESFTALQLPAILAKKDPDRETFEAPQPVVAEVAALLPIPQPDAQALAVAARIAEELAASQAREQEARRQDTQRQEARRQAQEEQAREREQEARRKVEEGARDEAMRRRTQEIEARVRAEEEDSRLKAETAAHNEALGLERQKQAAWLAQTESTVSSAARDAARTAAEDAATAGEAEHARAAGEARMADAAAGRADSPAQSGAPARLADTDRHPAAKAPAGKADVRPAERAAVPLPAAPPDNLCRQSGRQWNRPNLQVATYAAVWRHGIRQNAPFDVLQGAKSGPYDNPVVTVAVRSDGSIEAVTFNRSSGHAQIDDAVRRIIEMLAPYSPFPRELEMDCDVIEIPSIWSFDRALRLTWRGQ